MRGDTDFSLTSELDRWDDDRVRFVFGYERANLVQKAEGMAEQTYHELVTRAERAIATRLAGAKNVKDEVVRSGGSRCYAKRSRTSSRSPTVPASAPATPGGRLRKNISVERGDNVLFEEHRYFFYITNDWGMTADEVVAEARSRCNQENLIAQLKGGVRALHAPLNVLVANSAYMVMAASLGA